MGLPTLTPLAPPHLMGIYGSPMERPSLRTVDCNRFPLLKLSDSMHPRCPKAPREAFVVGPTTVDDGRRAPGEARRSPFGGRDVDGRRMGGVARKPGPESSRLGFPILAFEELGKGYI